MCFVVSSSTLGGAERQLSYLIEASKENYEVKLICYATQGPALELFNKLQVEFVHINLSQRFSTFIGPLRLFINLAKNNPRQVQTFLYKADILVTMFSYILPITHIYWTAGNIDLPGFSKKKKIALSFFSRSKKVKAIIANSKAAADWHLKIGYPSEKLQVIDNFLPQLKKRVQSKSRLLADGFFPDHVNIGMACRPVDGKGIPVLLSASQKLNSLNLKTTIHLIGDGMQDSVFVRETVVNLGIQKGVVLYPGKLDVIDFFEEIDLYVMASTSWESFPNSLTEAILVGCPVIASDVGGVANEIFGIEDTYRANSVDQLVERITNLLGQSSEERRTRALQLQTTTIHKFNNSQTYQKWRINWERI